MRSLSAIAISVLLMSTAQLFAQTPDRSAQASDPFGGGVAADPFGPDAVAPKKAATPLRRLLDPSPAHEPADQTKKPGSSQPEDLFPPIAVSRASAAYLRIDQALNREAKFDYLDQPLKDVVQDIAFSYKIPIIIDTRALEAFAIDTATPIIIHVEGVSLRSALRLMLGSLELTYVIRDEVLQITTPEAAEASPSTRFYFVAELVPPSGDGEVLVELIKTLVAPKTWCDCEGVGSIVYVEHLRSLAIRQTDEVFHDIEGLLATTKKLAEIQPPVMDSMSYGGFGGVISE